MFKPCPFCGSTNIGYSISVASRRSTISSYHMSMYCKDCYCYGRRILVKTSENRREIENNTTYKEKAIEAWNNRGDTL